MAHHFLAAVDTLDSTQDRSQCRYRSLTLHPEPSDPQWTSLNLATLTGRQVESNGLPSLILC